MAEKLNIGIIGAGNRGVNGLGKLITERGDARVAALTDSNPERLKAALGILPADMTCYTHVNEMLEAEKLDGLVITSPDYLHADHLVAAIQAGITHILVEKPIATTAAGCLQILEAMQTSPAHISIGFNLRHAPLARKIKEVIDSGLIGNLMIIENREFYDGGRTYMARWNRRYEWSGGLWVHKGSHDFDVFNWWNSGGNPLRVSASAGVNALCPEGIPFPIEPNKPVGPNCTACAYAAICPDFSPPVAGSQLFNPETAQQDGYLQDLCIYLSDKNTHDNGIALVEYDNNVRATHMECFVCNFTDRFYTIIGDRGTLMARLEDPLRLELRPRWGQDQIMDVPPAPEGMHGGADILLVDSFITNIVNGAPTASTLRDGIRAVVVGQAAELSWREHRMVSISELIDLNLPPLAQPQPSPNRSPRPVEDSRGMVGLRSMSTKTLLSILVSITLALGRGPARATQPPLSTGVWPALLAHAAILAPPTQSKVYITGRVTAQDGAEPLPDAAVSLLPQGGGAALVVARTLVNGSFFLAAPGPGSYRLTVEAGADYNALDHPIEVPASGVTNLELALNQPPALLLELIGEDGNPLHGGEVDVQALALPDDHAAGGGPFWLMQPARGTWGARTVSPDGIVKVVMPRGFAPTDIWELGIGVRDPVRGCKELFLDRWPAGKVQVRLEPGVSLEGTVMDSAGHGVPGAAIEGVGLSGNLGRRFLQGRVKATADATGHFILPALFQDRYDIGAILPDAGKRFHAATAGQPGIAVTISPADRSKPPLDIHFFRPNGGRTGPAKIDLLRQRLDAPPVAPIEVGGKVTATETGVAVPGATAVLMDLTPGEATLLDAAQGGPDGIYKLSAPGPGHYFWRIEAPGRSTVDHPIDVPAGGLTLNAPMLQAVNLDVHLLKPDGTPLTTGQVRSWLSFQGPSGGTASGTGLQPFPDAGFLTVDAPQNLDKLQEFVFGLYVPGVGCGQWRFDHWPQGPLTLQLAAGSTLRGQVVDDAGKGVANATVTLSPYLPEAPLYTLDQRGRFDQAWSGEYSITFLSAGNTTQTTDAEGNFAISQLMYGEYEARVKIPGVGLRYHLVSLRGSGTSIVLSSHDSPIPNATYTNPAP